MTAFAQKGWARFGPDRDLRAWVACALGPARAALRDPDLAQWHVCSGTWFVGVDALPNGPDGAVAGSGPLRGEAIDAIRAETGPFPPLHPAQLSVTWPGYPQPREGESEAAFRYRLNRDAAHVDGVRGEGAEKRRHVREPHAFILGIALTDGTADNAPLVVWENSHHIMARAFQTAFADVPVAQRGDLDITEIYQSARREVFETCQRVVLPLQSGEAVLVHRLALHGVAPWTGDAPKSEDGRMIAYFRPELADGLARWANPANEMRSD